MNKPLLIGLVTSTIITSYYLVKPILPRRVRYASRGWRAQRLRRRFRQDWPIKSGTERPPANWPGWPEGKQFAFVLTHDVEEQSGLARCRQLMDLEGQFGFRSSFNLIPEGGYAVPTALRQELTRRGFEVGVHDLHHDGKLFRSHTEFIKQARRINHYLGEWGASGFRAGFMFHNLAWLRDLKVSYDASTFDADPFEPQPDGVNTIFPFWVNAASAEDKGYVELPYTLVQDSTLFLSLRDRNIDVWKQKLDWVAKHGGMVLVDTHPDYMAFDSSAPSWDEYPAAFYAELLDYVRTKYAGRYWHALPREVAEYCTAFKPRRPSPLARTTAEAGQPKRATGAPAAAASVNGCPPVKIWIDLDNTPHIPFFKPIVRELEKRGHTVILTARDAFQVCELAARFGFKYARIGRHYGKNRLMKVLGLAWRSLQLLPFALRERPALALSHGSRAQMLLCNRLRIPTVMINDYEHAQTPLLMRPRWEIVPDVLFQENMHCQARERLRTYQGIKEDVYAPEFKPDPALRQQLQLDDDNVIVTVRPPATEAHYHNPESETLFEQFMDRGFRTPGVQVVLLPRNKAQETQIKANWPQWFADSKVIIPKKAVDGLNLLWYSDLVVSGGGTMNREAAALGVPVYSIFRGRIGGVDRQLEQDGRLTMIRNVGEVQTRICFTPRDKTAPPDNRPRQALQDIVDHLEHIIRVEAGVTG